MRLVLSTRPNTAHHAPLSSVSMLWGDTEVGIMARLYNRRYDAYGVTRRIAGYCQGLTYSLKTSRLDWHDTFSPDYPPFFGALAVVRPCEARTITCEYEISPLWISKPITSEVTTFPIHRCVTHQFAPACIRKFLLPSGLPAKAQHRICSNEVMVPNPINKEGEHVVDNKLNPI